MLQIKGNQHVQHAHLEVTVQFKVAFIQSFMIAIQVISH